MRVERIGLKNHCHASIGGIHMIHVLVPDPDFAFAEFLKSSDDPQEGGLTASGRADEYDEFAVVGGKVDSMDDLGLSEPFYNIVELKSCHAFERGLQETVR
jgi:hypothetical protein